MTMRHSFLSFSFITAVLSTFFFTVSFLLQWIASVFIIRLQKPQEETVQKLCLCGRKTIWILVFFGSRFLQYAVSGGHNDHLRARSRVLYLFVPVSIVTRQRYNFSFIHSGILLHKTVWITACRVEAIFLSLDGNHWQNITFDSILCYPWYWQVLEYMALPLVRTVSFFVLFLTELTPAFIKLFMNYYMLIMLNLSTVYHSVVENLLKGHRS
jgi:hypothetical protein